MVLRFGFIAENSFISYSIDSVIISIKPPEIIGRCYISAPLLFSSQTLISQTAQQTPSTVYQRFTVVSHSLARKIIQTFLLILKSAKFGLDF